MNDIEKARQKKELEKQGFSVTYGKSEDIKLGEIVEKIASGKMVVYQAEDFMIANMEAVKNGQIRIVPIQRVLTEEEVIDLPEDAFVWIEIKEDHDTPTVYCLRVHAKWFEQTSEMFIDFDTPTCLQTLMISEYGKGWRCWSTCPTADEQEGTEWDCTRE